MTEISARFLRMISVGERAGMLRIGLLLVLSAVSVSANPQPEIKTERSAVNLPRYYCAADLESLGTGLSRPPMISATKLSSRVVSRWTGWVRSSASGKYEFSLPDSGGKIFINQQQIFSQTAKSFKPHIIHIDLATNRFYAITVETLEGEYSTLPLKWRRPDGRHETVPTAYLYPPLATARVKDTSINALH